MGHRRTSKHFDLLEKSVQWLSSRKLRQFSVLAYASYKTTFQLVLLSHFVYVESVFLKFIYQKPCLEKKSFEAQKDGTQASCGRQGTEQTFFLQNTPQRSRRVEKCNNICGRVFGEISGIDQEAQRKKINENEKNCSEKTSEDNDKSISSSEDRQSTEVGERAVEGGSFNQQQEIKRAYDLADIVIGKRPLTDLTDEDKYNYLKYNFKPSATEKFFSLKISKNGKEKTLLYQHSWLEEMSWHVYSPELNRRLCKLCVLFDKPHKKAQRGAFVASAFQKLQRSELIKAHAETDCHKAAVAQGSDFMRTFMHPENSVEADKTSEHPVPSH
eukprot:gene5368-546_t